MIFSTFPEMCAALPEDFHWGEPLTLAVFKHIELAIEQAARATPADHISQARDAEYRALLGLQSSVEESVRNGLMDVSVEQSLATVQATQSASPEAEPKGPPR